mgnify:FL=1
MLTLRISKAHLRGVPSRLTVRLYSIALDKSNPKTSKVWASADEAVRDVKSGDILLCGGEFRIDLALTMLSDDVQALELQEFQVAHL